MCNEVHIRKAITQRKCGAPCKIRTCGPRFRKPVLYPTELRGHDNTAITEQRKGTKKRSGKAKNGKVQ